MPNFAIRPARVQDAALVLTLLTALADYEKLLGEFSLSEADIRRDFFGPEAAIACELAFEDDAPVGIVTWYWTYASFRAARGLFVEDLFVLPACRGKGYGKGLLRYLAAKALGKGAAQLEWLVLDWNAPAIDFYKRIGAKKLEGWDTYLLQGDALKNMGAQ